MDSWPIIISGMLQGFGVGLVWVPLSTVAFTTLPANLRNEGTAFFNLLRNVGSSIGISVVIFLLTQNIQRMHVVDGRTCHALRYFQPVRPPCISISRPCRAWSGLNGAMFNQAAMIAYIDDFQLMMVLTLATIPFLFLIKKVRPTGGGHAVLE